MNKDKALARAKRRKRQLNESKGKDRDYLAAQLQKAKQQIKELEEIIDLQAKVLAQNSRYK